MNVQARADATPSHERPFDQFLLALRVCAFEYRAAPEPPADVHERAYATCPSCRIEGCLPLELVERRSGAQVELDCWSGCSEREVRRALARALHLELATQLEAA
jgi:hypothetical protein